MPAARPSTWASFLRLVAWVLVVGAAGGTALRWVDAASSPVALVQSLTPYAAVLVFLALCGTLLPGPWKARVVLAGACLLVLAVHAAIWVPWLTEEEPQAGTELTVMTVNLYVGRADLEAVVDEVRRQDADILVLTEVSPGSMTELVRLGIDDPLPHALPDPVTARGSTIIRSRLPLTPLPAQPAGSATLPVSESPVGVLAAANVGKDVVVRGVHPTHPVGRRVELWHATLNDLTGAIGDTRGPMIVAGDFNASVDHPVMRQLMAPGLRDAHEVAGAGRPATWPRERGFVPFVHIDHVLVRGLDVASATEVVIPGSDHEAVVARVVVPAG
ncbi:MAG: endonuclease/exonuclease/phosphatase family protein [Nocardioidaceae bacterium]